ncbi:MAG: anhydro-N-acetylmuramic acid kinase [Pirellulales bacterium]
MPILQMPSQGTVGPQRREVIGIAFGSGLRRATAVLAGVTGRGLASSFEVVQAVVRVPSESVMLAFSRLSHGTPGDAGSLAWLATQLADIGIDLVRELSRNVDLGDCLAIGVDDPGFWQLADDRPRGRVGICDGARLAEITGQTVIDDYPARDLACGGQGGPVDALAQWVLLRDKHQDRVLIDLGRTTRLTYVPAFDSPKAADRVLAFDVGPGMELLDRLTLELTQGERQFDPGGQLAVQGRQIPELLVHLLDSPLFQAEPTRWHPRGIAPDWLVAESIRLAIDNQWAMQDVLCTATHLIAESIARAIREHVPPSPSLREVIYAGGGQLNGLLLRELGRRLPQLNTVRLGRLGGRSEHLPAACAAVLVQMHLDQVPMTHMLLTGSDAPRVLGRLNPGAPWAWRRLLAQIMENSPATMPLRRAV